MKTIAFYLPQFHTIPENDEWWGKGFTEWTTVKKGRALFDGHKMPIRPLNDNYYCLLDSKVQENQSELALNNGIDGFCYYHYWFNGKLLLEKPMENMLNNPNIKIPFCICWANESWARTWDGKDTNYLIKQNYNESVNELREHYYYLQPFFKDSRYIKENNKPLVVIYKPQLITNLDLLKKEWENLAIKDGFSGIYWCFQHPSAFKCTDVLDNFDMGIEFEPLYTDFEMEGKRASLIGINRFIYGILHPIWLFSKLKKKIKKIPSIRNYDEVYKIIIERKPINKKIAAGAFPSWDNTARKGNNGIVFQGACPKKFEKYLKLRLNSLNKFYRTDYLFINAWNEWGEGAVLEPDDNNEYGYLHAVKRSIYCNNGNK